NPARHHVARAGPDLRCGRGRPQPADVHRGAVVHLRGAPRPRQRRSGARVLRSPRPLAGRGAVVAGRAHVALPPVTRANVRAVCDLRLAPGQEDLVAPAAYTVAEGMFEPDALLRVVYAGDEVAGIAAVELATGTPYLVRFMIGEEFQSRGIGGAAIALLIEEL